MNDYEIMALIMSANMLLAFILGLVTAHERLAPKEK